MTEQSEASGGGVREAIVAALKECYDPEIPVNIYDLGLIYVVEDRGEGEWHVDMTLTSPHCPVAEILPEEVRTAVQNVEGVRCATVDVVWDPPWSEECLSEAARLELGMI